MLEFTNENDAIQKCDESLNKNIKWLKLKNKTLHNIVALSNEKPSTSHEHLEPHVDDRVLIRTRLNKTPYELWKDRKPNIGYFKVFGCKCFILNKKDNLGKFDPKSDVGIFLGYSNSSKAYRVYNKRTLVMEESIHVTFD